MAYLDYPVMGPPSHRMTMAYLDYPAMVPSVIDDHGLFRLSFYGPLSHR